VPRIKGRSNSFSPTLSFASNGLSQEEILQHKIPLSPGKRSTARAANYLAVICLRPSFNFDHLIVGIAVGANEGIERRWPASRHATSPITILDWVLRAKTSRGVTRLSHPTMTWKPLRFRATEAFSQGSGTDQEAFDAWSFHGDGREGGRDQD
jgi:hypothetical protein